MMRRRAWRLADKRRITAAPEDFLEAFSYCGIRSASALGTVSGGRCAESLQRLVVTVWTIRQSARRLPPILADRGGSHKPTNGAFLMMRNLSTRGSIESHLSATALPGSVSTNPTINRDNFFEAVEADVASIISVCSTAAAFASGNRCREAVRFQVIGFLHEVASAGRVEVRHG